MNITYREYTDQDKAIVDQLEQKLSEHIKRLDPLKRIKNNPGFAELSLQDTFEKIAKYQGKVWFAQDGKKIIGFVVGIIEKQSEKNKLEIGQRTIGDVTSLYIEEDYRGKGIGTALLKIMEEYFKSQGCDSMWVEVFAPNINAHQMYRKYGFVDREIGMLKEL